jgi:tetratricopeptide (TPR) repeat protein
MKSGMDGPYPGSRPFGRADREVFFGRADDADLIAEWWRVNNLTYVVGPAGRGKTSLLQAGVLPRVLNRKLSVLPVGRLSTGVAFPVAALPPHNPYPLALLRSWSAGETSTRLATLSIRDFVGTISGRGPILAAIDPVDELNGSNGPRQRHRRDFLAELEDALHGDPRLHLLIIGREQAVGLMTKVLGNGLRYEIQPLTKQKVTEAVAGPMTVTGRRFADGAAERLVKDLMTSRLAGRNGAEQYVTTNDPVEPVLLQVTCARLWDSLPPDGSPVTVQDVRGYGDVDQALNAWVSQTISEVADEYDLSAKRLATWLVEAFVTEIGTRNKQYEGLSATARMPNAIPSTLEDRHLLTSSVQSAGNRWYELISDRLVESVRQLGASGLSYDAVERPDDGMAGRLFAAERALAEGELELAKRQATALRDAARSRTPSNSEVFALLGKAYSLLGNIACEHGNSRDAEAQYREAMTYFGAANDSQAVGYQLTAIGHLLLEQGRTDEAVSTLDSALKRLRNDPVVRVFYATALWQLGEGRAAIAVLNEALSIDGDHADALRTRGEILADLGEARDAIRDLDRVLDTDRPATRAARGLALAELGERRAARQEIEKAISEGERSGPALLYAARAFALIGDKIAAEENARLATDATDPPLSWRQLEMARRLVGQEN